MPHSVMTAPVLPVPTRLSTYLPALAAMLLTMRRDTDSWQISRVLTHPDGYFFLLTQTTTGQTSMLLFLDERHPCLPLTQRDGILVACSPEIPRWFLPLLDQAVARLARATGQSPLRLEFFLRPLVTAHPSTRLSFSHDEDPTLLLPARA